MRKFDKPQPTKKFSDTTVRFILDTWKDNPKKCLLLTTFECVVKMGYPLDYIFETLHPDEYPFFVLEGIYEDYESRRVSEILWTHLGGRDYE